MSNFVLKNKIIANPDGKCWKSCLPQEHSSVVARTTVGSLEPSDNITVVDNIWGDESLSYGIWQPSDGV